jgi:hypothetical protein
MDRKFAQLEKTFMHSSTNQHNQSTIGCHSSRGVVEVKDHANSELGDLQKPHLPAAIAWFHSCPFVFIRG